MHHENDPHTANPCYKSMRDTVESVDSSLERVIRMASAQNIEAAAISYKITPLQAALHLAAALMAFVQEEALEEGMSYQDMLYARDAVWLQAEHLRRAKL